MFIDRYGNANVWKIFTDLFDYFPLTTLVSRNSIPYSLFFSSSPLPDIDRFCLVMEGFNWGHVINIFIFFCSLVKAQLSVVLNGLLLVTGTKGGDHI